MSLFQKIGVGCLIFVVSILAAGFGLLKLWELYDGRRLMKNYGPSYKKLMNSYKKTSVRVK